MADFSALKTSIQNYIKQNGNEEITGNLLQQILLSMVTTLGDSAINNLVTALNAEITNRGNADIELGGRITTLQGVVNGIKANVENGYVYAGIATPSTTPASGKVFYLALTAGTYTNFGATVVPQGINILKYNGSAWLLDSFLGLDNAPTQGSNNLVKSGGVLDSIIKDGSAFDLSAYNSGTTYADLSAALTALNALPAAYKKGGMSVKFVRTSDNKYVQARLMANSFSTTVSDWQSVDDEPTVGSDNLVKSGGVYDAIQSSRNILYFFRGLTIYSYITSQNKISFEAGRKYLISYKNLDGGNTNSVFLSTTQTNNNPDKFFIEYTLNPKGYAFYIPNENKEGYVGVANGTNVTFNVEFYVQDVTDIYSASLRANDNIVILKHTPDLYISSNGAVLVVVTADNNVIGTYRNTHNLQMNINGSTNTYTLNVGYALVANLSTNALEVIGAADINSAIHFLIILNSANGVRSGVFSDSLITQMLKKANTNISLIELPKFQWKYNSTDLVVTIANHATQDYCGYYHINGQAIFIARVSGDFVVQRLQYLVVDTSDNTIKIVSTADLKDSHIILLYNPMGDLNLCWGQLKQYIINAKIENGFEPQYINKNIEFISREGYVNGFPTNSLISVVETKKFGIPFYRASVRVTSDGYMVLQHDDSINGIARNSDGTTLSETVLISETTLAELETYDFGLYFGSQFAGVKICRIEPFLQACSCCGLIPELELKVPMSDQQIDYICQLLIKYGLTRTAWIRTLYNAECTKFNAILPQLGVMKMINMTEEQIRYSLEIKTQYNRAGVAFSNNDGYPDAALVRLCLENNLDVTVGSVYDASVLLNWYKLGINRIEVGNIYQPYRELLNRGLSDLGIGYR